MSDDSALHIVERREVALDTRLQVDVVKAEVLAAILIPHIHDVAVVVGPEVTLDPAFRVVGDRPLVPHADIPDEHVQHAVERCDV